MSENKKSLMEAVESKGAGIVIPMLNPKDLQVKVSAVVPPAYADALECDKRWSERFKKQCAEVVDQHKDVLDFEDKDRIEGNKPVVAEKPVRVEDQKLAESLKESWKDFKFIVKCNDGPKELVRVVAENKSKAEGYAKDMYAANHTTYADDRYNEWSVKDVSYLKEALYGMNQIEQFVKMADAIGLKTMDDFKDFMDREGQGKDVLTALYDYLHNEIGDLDFQAKDESLKEDYQDVDSMSREELMDEIDGIYEWALKGKHIDITSIIEDPEVFPDDKDDEEGYFKGVPTNKLRGILKILRKMKSGGSLTKDDQKVLTAKDESLKESYLDSIKDPVYWQHQVDYQLEKFGRVGGGLIQDLDENGFYLNADNKVVKKLQEDIVKNSKGKWVNKGEEGTHGEFDTKKEADAQRKAMYANGYKESLTEDVEEESSTEEELKEPEAEVKINLEKFKPWGKAVDTYSQIQEAGKMEDFERILEEGWPDGIKDQTLNELLVEDKDWLAEVLDMEFIEKRVK